MEKKINCGYGVPTNGVFVKFGDELIKLYSPHMLLFLNNKDKKIVILRGCDIEYGNAIVGYLEEMKNVENGEVVVSIGDKTENGWSGTAVKLSNISAWGFVD